MARGGGGGGRRRILIPDCHAVTCAPHNNEVRDEEEKERKTSAFAKSFSSLLLPFENKVEERSSSPDHKFLPILSASSLLPMALPVDPRNPADPFLPLHPLSLHVLLPSLLLLPLLLKSSTWAYSCNKRESSLSLCKHTTYAHASLDKRVREKAAFSVVVVVVVVPTPHVGSSQIPWQQNYFLYYSPTCVIIPQLKA